MPANRPGRIYYPPAEGTARTHGQPIVRTNRTGVAVKQVGTGWDTTIAAQSAIAANEPYAMIVKGKVMVDQVTGFAKGDPIYIIAASMVLTETASGNVPYGYVTEGPGERGTPTGKVWIDLDHKPPIVP